MIWFDKPITGILLLLILALHTLSYFLHTPIWLTVVNGVCHAALFTVLFLSGGSLEEALLAALISTVAGLCGCPKPIAADETGNGTVKSSPIAADETGNGTVKSSPIAPDETGNGTVKSSPIAADETGNGTVKSSPIAADETGNGTVKSSPIAADETGTGTVKSSLNAADKTSQNVKSNTEKIGGKQA